MGQLVATASARQLMPLQGALLGSGDLTTYDASHNRGNRLFLEISQCH
jgi:hypothetical protein